jgi:hypothetical protein
VGSRFGPGISHRGGEAKALSIVDCRFQKVLSGQGLMEEKLSHGFTRMNADLIFSVLMRICDRECDLGEENVVD